MAWRLRIHRETPADISTTIGDVLHNLRSSLDALAYELARRTVDRDLTADEERVTEFPICRKPAAYRRFFNARRDGQLLRDHLYDERARAAMRTAQPFYNATLIDWPEEERTKHQRDGWEWSALRRLSVLNNIDKHRRLASVSVGRWLKLIYWGGDDSDLTQMRWGDYPVEDDTILCYLTGPKAKGTELFHEFALVLTDDPMHRPGREPYKPRDCLDLLHGFAQEVRVTTERVLRVYAHEAGATPPGPPDRG